MPNLEQTFVGVFMIALDTCRNFFRKYELRFGSYNLFKDFLVQMELWGRIIDILPVSKSCCDLIFMEETKDR